MKYNTQLINDLVRDNYFGCAPDTSKEEQDAIKLEWINCMAKRGWVLNKSVIISKARYARKFGRSLYAPRRSVLMHWYTQYIDPPFNPMPESLKESWASLIDPDGVECTILDAYGNEYDN